MFPSGIIASCQPRKGGYFTEDAWRFAAECEVGGAVAVRIEGIKNIETTSSVVGVPVIGLVKQGVMGQVWITPACKDAEEIVNAGADYVAADATGRWGYEQIKKMVAAGYKVIGDIATLDQAIRAEELGCVGITTALAGYTDFYKITSPFEGPDFVLLESCVKALSIPVIAEGRIHTLKMVQMAFSAGAHAVCIGAAITLPHFITQHFRIPYEQVVNSKDKKFWMTDWPKLKGDK